MAWKVFDSGTGKILKGRFSDEDSAIIWMESQEKLFSSDRIIEVAEMDEDDEEYLSEFEEEEGLSIDHHDMNKSLMTQTDIDDDDDEDESNVGFSEIEDPDDF